MIFYIVIDLEIIFHLVYRMLKMLKIEARRALQSRSKNTFLATFYCFMTLFTFGCQGQRGITRAISPAAKKEPDITLTLVNLHNI